MDAPANITQLPFDILDEVNAYLNASDFLAFTSTCRQFREALYNDSGYWKSATINAFRVRNRPSTDNEGMLWRKLYRRLQTQTKIFMWGQASTDGNPERIDLGSNGEVNPGIIADLQCGGWCTAFLNNRGEVYLKGKVDGEAFNYRGINHNFSKLKFPDDASEKSTRIRQLSAGRKHLFGLADDGTVWLWYGASPPAKKFEFFQPAPSEGSRLHVSHVVAGWATSAVYAQGKGIILWQYNSPFTVDGRENEDFMNNDYIVVPRSSYDTKIERRARTAFGDKALLDLDVGVSQDDVSQDPGEVVSFVLLEHLVLFCTDRGQLLVHKVGSEASLTIPGLDFVVDVQGSFRSFAIFTRDGAVMTAQQDILEDYWTTHDDFGHQAATALPFVRIPALQNSGVIQVAFGDYHFHALHSDGRITSYGKDPGGCGALGLGRLSRRTNARGVVQLSQWNQDAELVHRATQKGRAIWLLDDQSAWADYVSTYLDEQPDIDDADLGDLSDWIEQAGSGWGGGLDENQDHLGPFFALSIAAGGWSGGALVLVNDDLVQAIKRKIANRIASGSGDDELYARGDTTKWRYLLDATAHGLPNVELSRGGNLVSSEQAQAESQVDLAFC